MYLFGSKKGAIMLSIVTLFTFLLTTSFMVFAQEAGVPVNGSNIDDLIGLYLANKGSTLGLVAFGVQALMYVINKTTLADKWVKGKVKILAVAGLTLGGAVVVALQSGGGFASVIGDATVLTALQVLVHQALKSKGDK